MLGALGAFPAAAAASAPAAFAHHSTALVYDRAQRRARSRSKAAITEVAWVNPHVRFKLRGAGPDGVEREVGDRVELRQQREPLRFNGRARRRRHADRSPATAAGSSTTCSGSRTCCCRTTKRFCSARAVRPRWSQQTIGPDVRSAVTADTRQSRPLYACGRMRQSARVLGRHLPLTPGAAAARAAYDPLTQEPTANCAPKGMPFIMEQPYPMEIAVAGDEILIQDGGVRHRAARRDEASA